MADRVDTAMNGMQSTASQTMRDRAPAEPEGDELRPRDHSVLTLRDGRNPRVQGMNSSLCTYDVLNDEFTGHAVIVAPQT
jgi:hypothetical protein